MHKISIEILFIGAENAPYLKILENLTQESSMSDLSFFQQKLAKEADWRLKRNEHLQFGYKFPKPEDGAHSLVVYDFNHLKDEEIFEKSALLGFAKERTPRTIIIYPLRHTKSTLETAREIAQLGNNRGEQGPLVIIDAGNSESVYEKGNELSGYLIAFAQEILHTW